MIIMERKPYTVESYKAGKKAVTRDGQNVVSILMHDPKMTEMPFSFLLDSETGTYIAGPNGNFFSNSTISKLDLFELPEKKEGWINLYRRVDSSIYLGVKICSTEEDAVFAIGKASNCVATVKIEWEE